MPDGEQFLDAPFPLKGVNGAAEFWRQAELTAAFAKNVRGEVPAGRRCGGARMGLVRYIDATVNGANLIQHLNVVVDPQAEALTTSDSPWDSTTGVLDTSTNNLSERNPGGRYFRPGGSGTRPNRHIPSGGGSGADIAFVQAKSNNNAIFSGGQLVTTLDVQPLSGDLIVACFVSEKSGTLAVPPSAVHTNAGAGTPLTQVGGVGYEQSVTNAFGGGSAGSDITSTVTMWYLVSTGSADDQIVKATPAAGSSVYAVVCVYRNAALVAPLTNQARNASSSPTTTFTAGSLALNGTAGQLVVACFTRINASPDTPGTGYTERGVSVNNETYDQTGLSGVGPVTPDATGASRTYAAMCAAFKK